jgi:uncharacterized protein YdeI (YjbR/CyaY-like superfamily)
MLAALASAASCGRQDRQPPGGAVIRDVEDYFALGCGRCARFATDDCSARRWAVALAGLRRLCLDAGLTETVKWGHPCYVHAGRNVAILGAFRGDVRLTFFDAARMDDPGGLLQRQGPNSRVADAVRVTDPAGVAPLAEAIRALLAQAMARAAGGAAPPRPAQPVVLPDDLAQALAADPALAAAFARLTPGRQRSHVIALSRVRSAAGRVARMAALRDRILAGRGATERAGDGAADLRHDRRESPGDT